MIAGYVAWCSRAFYLTVAIPEIPPLPEESRLLFIREIEASGLQKPMEFRMNLFWRNLVHPYDSSSAPIRVYQPDYATVLATRPGKYVSTPKGYYGPAVELVERDGRWVLSSVVPPR